MPKKNIYLIVFTAVAVFLLLLGFLLFFNYISGRSANVLFSHQAKNQIADDQIKNHPPAGQPVVSPGVIRPDELASSSPLDLAEKYDDVSQCLAVKDNPDYVNTCISLLADHTKDGKICAKISDPAKSQYCSDRLAYYEAAASNKISSCLNIKTASLKEACVGSVINNTPDLKATDCVALPDLEEAYCLNYVNFSAAMSQLNSAKSAADCQSITFVEVKQECLKKTAK
jgi:hypothetical protein